MQEAQEELCHCAAQHCTILYYSATYTRRNTTRRNTARRNATNLTAHRPQATLVKLGKKLKKNSVAMDIVNFGEEAENAAKLEVVEYKSSGVVML